MNETVVACVTPFLGNRQIDFDAFENLLLFHLKEVTSSVLILGSTSEGALLTFEEKKALIEKTSAILNRKKPFIVSISSPSTMECVQLAHLAKEWGAKSVLCTLPYYIRTTFEGLITHFKQIQDVGIELILYENPGRIFQSFSYELLERLIQFEHINELKASTTDFEWVEKVQKLGYKIYCGDDINLFEMKSRGIDANISVTANAFPSLVAQMETKDDFQTLKPLVQAIFLEPNPVGIKYVLSLMNLCKDIVRYPLLAAQPLHQEKIQNALNSYLIKKN